MALPVATFLGVGAPCRPDPGAMAAGIQVPGIRRERPREGAMRPLAPLKGGVCIREEAADEHTEGGGLAVFATLEDAAAQGGHPAARRAAGGDQAVGGPRALKPKAVEGGVAPDIEVRAAGEGQARGAVQGVARPRGGGVAALEGEADGDLQRFRKDVIAGGQVDGVDGVGLFQRILERGGGLPGAPVAAALGGHEDGVGRQREVRDGAGVGQLEVGSLALPGLVALVRLVPGGLLGRARRLVHVAFDRDGLR